MFSGRRQQLLPESLLLRRDHFRVGRARFESAFLFQSFDRTGAACTERGAAVR
jgi:hypothetical protein